MNSISMGHDFTAADIQRAHDSLGYKLGWRFLTCPAANIVHAKLLLVTLNTGGSRPDGPGWSQELGSAYFVES